MKYVEKIQPLEEDPIVNVHTSRVCRSARLNSMSQNNYFEDFEAEENWHANGGWQMRITTPMHKRNPPSNTCLCETVDNKEASLKANSMDNE